MTYTPHTPREIEEMLEEIGVSSIEDLFNSIPEDDRMEESLDLPPSLSEQELYKHIQDLSDQNEDYTDFDSYLGGGMYFHYTPAVVSEMSSRNEFYTAYTPYQAEASQGILQAFYEYQTMLCNLTGMELSNASLYDGPSALAEALLMLLGESSGEAIYLPDTLHPEYREVVHTYLRHYSVEIRSIPMENGTIKPETLQESLSEDPGPVVVQQPNFLGHLEPVHRIAEITEHSDSHLVSVVEPLSLAYLEPPGNWNAEVVVGDLQPFGIPLNYGGPSAGFLTTKEKHLRKVPGRLIGRTHEKGTSPEESQTTYVMTLQTREQHIRREKATSNICTNQGLLTLHATVYLAALGQNGIRKLANLCLQKSHYLKQRITELPGFDDPFPDQSFFNEFVVSAPESPDQLNKALLDQEILGGLSIQNQFPDIQNPWLLAATEWNKREEMERFIDELEEITT